MKERRVPEKAKIQQIDELQRTMKNFLGFGLIDEQNQAENHAKR